MGYPLEGMFLGTHTSYSTRVAVTPCKVDRADIVLSPDAVDFVAALARRFSPDVRELLQARIEAQAAYDRGMWPAFRDDTEEIRGQRWKIAPLPDDLQDRRVEITGPVGRKMVINALNSGANVFMADFEDATSPTWSNMVAGQVNLYDAVRGAIEYTDTKSGRGYALHDTTATLVVRPRGWHLCEKHLVVDGEPVPGALFDFGLFLYHNAHTLMGKGSGPYFYLPKLQGHLEARLWNDVFVYGQDALNIPAGSIKATVLIETLPAAFEMDEILYELREHSAGLNCGRWDYMFSFIKTFRSSAEHVLPDRATVTMTQSFMRAYTQLEIKTCHRRGAPAIGGMAAQIPVKGDTDANRDAIDRVRADKLREVRDGHDGTWVAHPALVKVAKQVFDTHMPGQNQIHLRCDDVSVSEEALRLPPRGPRTFEGLSQNIRVGVQYLASWLRGSGCVPINHLMEDAATAEICRSQVWQWIRHAAPLEDGRVITRDLVAKTLDREMAEHRHPNGQNPGTLGTYKRAADLFMKIAAADEMVEFLTIPAYEMLDDIG